MKTVFGVMSLVVIGMMLMTSMPAHAQTRDIDFDWVATTVDRLLAGFAPGITVKLGERDNDGNGIWEEDSLALLSAVLRGGTRVAGINAADVTAVQAAFAYNRNQAYNDMAATGFTCTLLGIVGYPCKLGDILVDPVALGPIAGALVRDLLLDYVAGITTVADNPATITAFNAFLGNVVESFAGTLDSSLWTTARGLETPAQMELTASNYHNWGATPHTASGARNMFGAAGDFDRDGTTNITEYTAAGYTGVAPNSWREAYLASNLIPAAQLPIRFTVQPRASDSLNHITNGDFGSGTTEWTLGGGWSINARGASTPTGPFQVMAHAAGAANTLTQLWASQNVTPALRIQPNTTYRVQLDMLNCNAAGSNITVKLGNGTPSAPMTSTTTDVVGGDTKSVYVTSGAAANPDFILTPDTTAFWIDNVIINLANLGGDYLDFGIATNTTGHAPYTLLWEDARGFPGGKDDTTYVFYHLVNLVDGTPGAGDTGVRGTSTYDVNINYLLPSHDGMAPWMRLSDTYTSPTFTSATVHNPANPQGNPPTGCIEADALGGRTTPMSIVRVGALAFAISPQPQSAHKFVGQSVTFTSAAVGGDSIPSYAWTKDGSGLPAGTPRVDSTDPLHSHLVTDYTIPSVALSDAGSYVMTATNDAGALASNAALLEVGNPLVFTVQPVGANKAAGDSHSMMVTTTGGFAPVTYQWKKDGANVTGATSTTLALTALTFSANQGTYTCVATDKYGNTATSNGAMLRVLDIQVQPLATAVTSGNSAQFTLTVWANSGQPTYTYQWRKNGVNIVGNTSATTNTLILPACVMADDADYSCLVTDSTVPAGVTLLSAVRHLTVNAAALSFTQQPANASKYVGDTQTFTVAVSVGSGFTKTYQWKKGGVAIPNATNASYTITPLATTDAGSYTCDVGEVGVRPPAALIASNPGVLQVQPRMSFTQQPAGANKAAGMSHTFTAAVTGGYSPYTYQWYLGGVPVASGSSYTIPSLTFANQGTYTCVVNDSLSDTKTSTAAVLTVLAISTQPADRDVNAGSPATFTVGVTPGSGVPGYTYQWRKNGVNIVGNTSATTPTLTINPALPGDAGTYSCVVTDSALASLTSANATLSVTTQTITISPQPLGGNKYVSDSKTFTSAASGGNGTLTYQWQKDGVNIVGNSTATTNSLTISSLALGDQGNYQLLVGDLAHGDPPLLARVASNSVYLQVRDRMSISVQPVGAHLAVGGNQTFSITVNNGYTPLSYQWYKGASPVSTANPYSLTNVQFTDQATYHCTVTDSNSATIDSNNVDLTVLAIQTSPADREVPALASTTFTVVVQPGSGFGAYTYQWRKNGANVTDNPSATTSSFTISPVMPADAGAYDCVVGDAGGASLASASANLSVVSSPIYIDTATTPAAASKYVGVTSGFNFRCAASGGSGTLTYQWQKDGVDLANDAHIGGVTTDQLNFTTSFVLGDEGVYQCMVGDSAHPPLAKVGSGLATLHVRNKVAISSQPAGGHQAAGTSHAFTVVATGGYLPLSYTWQYSPTNGAPIPWVTAYTGGATYNLPSLTAANQGYYRCVVSDSLGSSTANSATVNLLVLDIQTQPASSTANVGSSATFNVVVASGSGVPPYTYQWKYKGANISGATASSYTRSSIQAGAPDGNPAPLNPTGNAGDYVCRVTDSGSGAVFIDSAAAILTVNYTPMSVSLQPLGADKYTGGSHTFTVQATGGAGAPYTYQWQKGGVDISGRTTSSLALSPLGLGDEGDYRCTLGMVGVRPPLPLIASDTVTLRVRDPLAIAPAGQPLGANKAAGDSHTFTVAATGGYTPLAYQWYRGLLGATPGTGTPVGSNSDTLLLANLAVGDQGTYSCVVTDAGTGSATTMGADLRVLAIETPPASQTVDVRQPVTFTVAVVANSGVVPYTYQWQYKGDDIAGATNASYTIASCQAGSPDAVPQPLNPTGNAGDYACIVRDAAPTALVSAVATLTVNMAPITFTGQPASARKYVGGQQTFHVAVTGGAGPAYTYQWTKDGSNIANATTDTLALNPVAPEDAGSYACMIGEAGVRPPEALVPSDTATLETAQPIQIDTQPNGADLYVGETFTTSIAASQGFGTLTYQWYKGAALLSGETNSTFTKADVQLGDLGNYHCVVSDDLPTPVTSGDAALTVSPPISITIQPVGGEVEGGQGWSFSVAATGGKGALHYAWTRNLDPVGTDSPTYTIATAGLGDAGSYVCTVSDSGTPPTSLASNPVSLTIHAVFAIDHQPGDGKAYRAEPFTFSIHATFNRGELSYQWSKDQVAIPDATLASLTFPSASQLDVGTYQVTVTDDNGTPANPVDDVTLVSDLVTLTVADHLSIVNQPEGGERPVGGWFVFSVETIGGFSPLSYEWFKDSGSVVVGTNRNLTLNPISDLDYGAYHVEVRDNNTDIVVSLPATLANGQGLPVAGGIGLAVLAGISLVVGVARLRRNRNR